MAKVVPINGHIGRIRAKGRTVIKPTVPFRVEVYQVGIHKAWNYVVVEKATRRALRYGRGFISKRAAFEHGNCEMRDHAKRIK